MKSIQPTDRLNLYQVPKMGEKEFSAESAQEILKNEIESQEQKTINNGVYTALANIPKEALVDEDAMAEAFGVCTRTVKRMVMRFELPPPIKIRGKSMWVVGRVLDWINSQAELAEKEALKQLERVKKYFP